MSVKFSVFPLLKPSLIDSHPRISLLSSNSLKNFNLSSISSSYTFGSRFLGNNISRRSTRKMSSPAAVFLSQHPILSDVVASGFSSLVALSVLRFWGEIAKRGIFDQKLIRKLVHISIGLVFMLCWPLFSSGRRGAIFAAFTPGVNIIRVLLLGFGVYNDEATIKSMTRYGDKRELLKGPLYYVLTISLACIFYWRTSPISIAAICNLCAGDGVADIIGRRFGKQKLAYNKNKSIAGSVAMAIAGFIASLGFMYYFASFGFIQYSWGMIVGFLVVSLASTLVESLPVSTELDDNLTITLTCILLGSLVF